MSLLLPKNAAGVLVLVKSLALSTIAFSQQPAATPIAHPQPDATGTAVTTTGGTNGILPVFTGASTIVNSNLYFKTGKLGIGRTPSTALDISGGTLFGGQAVFAQTGAASSTSAWSSNALQFQSSVYNSTTKSCGIATFRTTQPTGWQ